MRREALPCLLLFAFFSACAGAPPPTPETAGGPEPEAAPSAAATESAPRPEPEPDGPVFMFELHREGLPVSYLHGSVHLLPEGPRPHLDVYDAAFERCEVLVVEVDLGKVDAAEMRKQTTLMGMYAPGDDITAHVPAEVWQAVEPVITELGMPLPVARQMRPWLLSVSLSMLDLQQSGFEAGAGVDQRYLDAARQGRGPGEVVQLETAVEQLRALAELPEETQALMLADAAERAREDDMMERMLDAWHAGDVERLGDTMFEPLRENPALQPMYDAMFFERNERMAERLQTQLQGGRAHFVVIGAGHLVGPKSVPDLLRAAGFEVTQVGVAAGPGEAPAPAPSAPLAVEPGK